ncbi:MAG: hypothetical protein Q9187_000764 [Circinaria calcarea]
MASMLAISSKVPKVQEYFRTAIESPTLHSIYKEGVFSVSTLYTVLALWATYCFCGAIYRRKTLQRALRAPQLTMTFSIFRSACGHPGPKASRYYLYRLFTQDGQVQIHWEEDIELALRVRYAVAEADRETAKESMVATIAHDTHRKRRGAMANFFSKSSVRAAEPFIQTSLKKLLARMENASKTGEIMPMLFVFKAATSDIITKWAFGKSTNFMDYEDYNAPFFKGIESTFLASPALMHFGWLGPLMEALPPAVVTMLMPGLADMWHLRAASIFSGSDSRCGWMAQIDEIKNSKDKNAGKNTIFDGVLKSRLPEEEKATARLGHEAQLTVLAGQDTTASTLSSAVFELLANPHCLKKLREELIATFPDPDVLIDFSQIEQLPYLGAVIQECLRCHPGVITRMARVSPEVPVVYARNGLHYVFPAGTPMSMTSEITHTNAEFFLNPKEFRPERWIENPRLDKYLIAFSRGSRNCLGINLAYQELYTMCAGIFRKYDLYDGTGKQQYPTLELYDTIRERDVDMNFDYIVPFYAKGSKSVQIKVHHP